MASPAPAMWTAAYDYVRLTSRMRGDDDSTPVLYHKALLAGMARMFEGENQLKPWRWQGYSGAACPHICAGTREDGHIFQASGAAADDARGLGLPWDNVPRVDVAVTVWYETDMAATIAHHARISRRFSAGKGATGWKVTHIDGGEDGDTTYIGSRSSDTFIRVYDKWRESQRSEDYTYAIRYELECKGDAAAQVWAAAHRTAPGREYLAGLVRAVGAARGVFLPELPEAVAVPPPAVRTVRTDTERRLAWLRNQVAPSVAKLLTAGVSRDTILAELGL